MENQFIPQNLIACQFILQNVQLLVSLFCKTSNCLSVYSAKRQTACQFILQNVKTACQFIPRNVKSVGDYDYGVSLFPETSKFVSFYSAKRQRLRDYDYYYKTLLL